MKFEEHIPLAIEAFNRGNKDEALMHAAIAFDGTARRFFLKK